MTLTAGARLGSYEVVAPLGAGGMGEVYRARDNKLGRDVAIKVLPSAVAADPDRLARFEREARVLAALNHPNIAAIYGIDDSTEVRALILELVDGPTLADRIFSGPIPVVDAVAIARQIADALEAAHGQGVVHRDLKPSNLKVRPDGAVKVLDFGLAKLSVTEEDADRTRPQGLSQSPTITSPAMLTGTGVVLGTAAYMSPEQAKGHLADKRSDIWAFGCVLYEMLTGRRLFESTDVTETMAFVLTKDPDWSELPTSVPIPLRTLLKRCLERDRRRRVGDIAAVRFVLEDLADLAGTTPHANHRRTSTSHRPVLWVVAAAVIAIAAAAVILYRPRQATPTKAFAFSILPPEGNTFVTTALAGAPALSPDGRQIAYVAAGPNGRLLWVQSLDAFDARPLAGTEGAACPFWATAGGWLGFQVGAVLKRISVSGSQVQALGPAMPSARVCTPGTVNQSATILFSGGLNNTLASVAASGGESVPATERNIGLFDENHTAPQFLPDGQHYVLQVRGGADLQFQVWVGHIGSNERRLLLKDVTNARYAPPVASGIGHLLYVRGRSLVAHPFDAQRLALVGAPVTIAEGIGVAGGGALGDFDVSSNGVLMYRRSPPSTRELAWFDRTGKDASALGDREGNPRNNVRISPDGKWVAFTRMGNSAQDVFIADLSSGSVSRFTLDGGRSPVWSPDGSQLAYLRSGTIYRKPFTSSGSEVKVWSGPDTLAINDWSGDGKYLLLTRWDATKPALSGRSLWLLPDPLNESATHEPTLFQEDALHGQFGPRQGVPRWVAFDAFDGSNRQLFVRTMPTGPPAKWQVSENGGNTSRWRADGRELFFLSGATMVAAEFDAAPASRPRALRSLFMIPPAFGTAAGQYAPGWDVSPDGARFLTTVAAPDASAPAITVVMNWQSLLK